MKKHVFDTLVETAPHKWTKMDTAVVCMAIVGLIISAFAFCQLWRWG